MINPKERLEVLKGRYRLYLQAERAILAGQSYSMEGLSLTRANLSTVQTAIADLEAEIMKTERIVQSSTRARSRIVIPVDGVNMMRCKRLCRN